MNVLVQDANALLRATNASHPSLYRMFPDIDSPELCQKNLFECAQSYGKVYFDYLEKDLSMNALRYRCLAVFQRDFTQIDTAYLELISQYASYKCGGSRCGELSLALWLKMLAQQKPAIHVSLQSENGKITHAFVIYGITPEQFRQKGGSLREAVKLSELFQIFHDCDYVIVDPFLNESFEVRDFGNSELKKYLEKRKIHVVFRLAPSFLVDPSSIDRIEKTAAAVAKKALAELEKI